MTHGFGLALLAAEPNSSRLRAHRRTPNRTRSAFATVLVGALVVAVAGCGNEGQPHSNSSPAATKSSESGFSGKTSCSSVMYIGESTSLGMVVPQQIPEASERLEARLNGVGVKRLRVDVSGGRSSIERLDDRPNALDTIPTSFTRGFKGCYVVAIGVNDAANSSFTDSAGTARERIELVLNRIGNRPVLWPMNRTSAKAREAYAEGNMIRFNNELKEATKRHPNLRLYDWSSEMQPAWWEGDGIHDTRRGSRERALMYADALAVAFPQGMKPNASAIVGSRWGRPPSPANIPTLPAASQDDHSFWASNTAALQHYTSGPPHP